jgi:hypothetical protein
LDYLGKINPDKLNNIKGLNIIFVTHSPFILSDIPASHIVRLKEGEQQPISNFEQTFGANVHELLAHDFFMEHGFMGAFAEGTIGRLIDYLQDEQPAKDPQLVDSHQRLIDIIGEPLLKSRLQEMYDVKFFGHNRKEYLEQKIREFSREIESLPL